MNKVSNDGIKELLDFEDSIAVSVYMPTHRFPNSEYIQEDKIRFKNLIKLAKEELEANGCEAAEVSQITDELESKMEDNDFWQTNTDGLAIFCSLAGSIHFNLPIECEELVVVGDKYDVAPLLMVQSYNYSYYILSLATHNPILLKADMYGAEKVSIELPKSPESALNIDELHSNSKTARAGGHNSGRPGHKAHGQGDSRQAGQEEKLKFLRLIDDAILSSKDVNDSLPFVIAGTDDEASSYREITRIKHLLASHVSGNYTEENPDEVHAKSWPIVQREIRDKELSIEVERYGNLQGTGLSSSDVSEIAEEAKKGRVDLLTVANMILTHDTVTDKNEQIIKMTFEGLYKDSRIGAIARTVFDNGGKVLAAQKEDLPNGAEVAAIYRY